jgi:hypothetical protein
MTAVVEWLPFAYSLAKDIEKLTQYIFTGVQDSADFGSGIEKARLSLSLQAASFKSIKRVFFGAPVEHAFSQGLFAEFPLQTQLDIVNVLRYFKETLESNFKVVGQKFGADPPGIKAISNESISFGSYHTASLIRKLKWGFVEKSKIEKVIRELRSWNEQLLAIIQLQLIRTTVGSNSSTGGKPPELIKRLQEPGLMGDADMLGLSGDVQLARISNETPKGSQYSPVYLGIQDPWRYLSAPVVANCSGWRLVTLSQENVLLEFKEFVPDDNGRPSDCSIDRIKQLATILHEKKAERYRTLTCRGYFLDKENFVLAFDLPPNSSPQFYDLGSLLRQKAKMPDLEERFLLARDLAMSLSQFHAVGWVHKSFRSNKILFFPEIASSVKAESTPIDRPYLSGWEYSRPESEFSSRLNEVDEIEENVYRHPHQWGLPTVRFSKIHDIYSLGVVLLEIGLWKRAISLHRSEFTNCELGTDVRNYLVDAARHQRLRTMMGKRYQNVVLKCLQGIFGADFTASDYRGGSTTSLVSSMEAMDLKPRSQEVISSEDFNNEVCHIDSLIATADVIQVVNVLDEIISHI